MKIFIALVVARTKEFYRDRAALSWALLFPMLIIIGCAVAFSGDKQEIFNVGVIETASSPSQHPSLLDESYIKRIDYQNEEKALERLRHHQLDLVIKVTDKTFYWVNPESPEGRVIMQLLQQDKNITLQENTVSGRQVRYVDWVIPGVLGMNMMFGSLFGVGYVIVRYRKNGVLKRFQATPVNAFEFLAAQIISRLFIIIATNIVIYFGAKYFLDLTMLGSYMDLLIVGLLGGISLISLGLIMSARTDSEELAGGLLNMTTWPMTFLSGVWFSLDDTPQYMQNFAQALPLTHVVHAAREIMINGATLIDVKFNVLMMLVMSLVFLSSAAVMFRWHRTG